MRLRSIAMILVLIVAASGLSACKVGTKGGKKDKGEVTVYSGRKEKYIKPVVEAFEKTTGIKVILLVGDASQLANQILEEGNNPRADVYISNDAGTLGFLAGKGGLKKYESAATRQVRSDLRDSNNYWVGATARARVIMYNTDLVKKKDAPTTLADLTDPKWKGKFGLTTSANESMTGQVSAMRITKGDKFTEKWLKDIKANNPVLNKSHDPIRDAIGTGELSLGLVNSYYYYRSKAEGAPVGVVYPDQDDFGTIINVAGIGMVKGAKQQAQAEKFIDFIFEEDAQEIFAGVNKEMPVIDSVPTVDARPLDTFERADVKLEELGDKLDKTLEMMEKAGI